ncbi:glycosyltransferase [Aliivibrio fischeri]|uniref:CgeB family protein n=1 Tax=Aliivibrio fischeri TaxID=668 RepID=UPI002E32C19B|nr:glycosyltransferase [Aliivibrio fischeri]MCE7556867.1 glycosyltransferase [Aliivibrio fischeri]MCE7563325.1 glycosyltransferase [Aliivibrio fischeri]MCE7570254.1 glycosyltransferase [Aliivibrio fischeri]
MSKINKIFYVAFKYEYGKKENGLALNYKAFFENFVKLGYDVVPLFYEDYSHEQLQTELLKLANEYNPDMIFFILQKDQIDIKTLNKLKDNGHFTVNFFGDDQWRFDNWSSKYALSLSSCITTDKFSIEKYKKLGQENIVRSQWASLENEITNESENYKYDVSFIGGYNDYRNWFVQTLKKNGINVHCFGNGWDNGRISYSEMEMIFSSSKINLNISNSLSYDIRYLTSNVKTALIFLRSIIKKQGKNSSQIKARNFEIPVQGGFQLTDFVPSLDDYYEIGHDIACYADVDESARLIKYYLNNDKEREEIKIAGIKKSREQHLFLNRIQSFMIELEKIKETY